MSYADMLGMFKGVGKGVGPGVNPEQEQGGPAGMARAGGGALKKAGAMLMTNSPKLSQAMYMGDRAESGAYHDMLQAQNQQDSEAMETSKVRELFGGNKAVDKYLNAGPQIPTGGI